MLKFFLPVLILLLSAFALQAQDYHLYTEDFVMPDLRSAVIIYLKDGENRISPRKYRLESTDARVLRQTKSGYDVLLNRDVLYKNKGTVYFDVITEGKMRPIAFRLPVVTDIRFNFYTDSIKPILNYYVNVEGEFTDDKILPLDTSLVIITADNGHMDGMEWVLPRKRDFEKVTFTATYRYDTSISKTATLYLKRYADPRDNLDYQDRTEEEIKRGTKKEIKTKD